jgi:serine/threonine-protein kinase
VADVLEQLRTALGDRYEVERLVGEGGMATVYLARDLRHGRQVAIKTLRAELAASIGADRFLREIRVASSLQHPNILALYDSGEADGFLYYVMPYVEGESLRKRLDREQQLPLHDAVRIVREAAEGLAYAHERGVVHRDIKPENILLQNGHAMVADFGIARAVDAAGEKLTQTGMAVGTPHYMSPEQSLGADHADGRSDIYSLGCVLYELLAGQPPFDGPNSRAIMARHAMEQVPSLTIVRQTVPDELEDVVMQSLEKTPADRFQKMSEFAEVLADLEPTLATRRTTSRGVPAVRRSTPRGSRITEAAVPAVTGRRFKLPTGIKFWAPAGVVVLAGLGLAVWRLGLGADKASASSELDPKKIAVLYLQSQPGNDSLGFLADGLTEALIHELSGVPQLQVISSNGVRPYKNGQASLLEISRALQVGTMVQGSIGQSANQLRVTVSLLNAGTGVEIGSKTLERSREEIFALQDDLVKEVSTFLRQRLGQEITLRQTRKQTTKSKAWELLHRAEQGVGEVNQLLGLGDTAAAGRRLLEADSILALAQAADPSWSGPPVMRGWLAYRQTDLVPGLDRNVYSHWLGIGLGHADHALTLTPGDAEALELRGTLRYWRYLINLEPDPSAAAKLLADAEQDLRAAVGGSPNAAVAWTWLSHLLMNQSRTAEAKLAALKAYEADPYLASVRTTLWRLFQTSLDLEDGVEARHWCDEGQRRFPEYHRFTECQIWLFALKGVKPEVPVVWELLEKYVGLAPTSSKEYSRHYGQMLVAMALGRAGLDDSARRVAERARADVAIDPTRDLAQMEAAARLIIGDKEEALRLLTTYVAANPQVRSAMAKDETWWFRDLKSDPRWRSLRGLPATS